MAGLKNGHTFPEGRGEPYYISYGDLSPEFAVVTVRFMVWHVQDTASAHKDWQTGAHRYGTGAWMRAARVASLISANTRFATPLYLGLSAGVNYCLISRLWHSFPKAPPKTSPPLSDLTAITADGVPSAQISARNDSNELAASDFLLRKYTRVSRVQPSRPMSGYHYPPILGTVMFPLRSTNTRHSFLFALMCVDLVTVFRSPVVIEHPPHSWSSPLRLTPCCSTVLLSSTSCVWPYVQWKVLMSVGVVGAFACPGAITALAVSTTLPFAFAWYPY